MILVTGATGHIGNALVRQLRAAGKKVRALVLPGEDRSCLAGLDIEMVEGDVLQVDSLEQAMQGAKEVYHLAGIISILPGKNLMVRRVNVEGTRNIIRAARAAGVRRLLYTSSIHAIRETPPGIFIDESQPFDPANPRGEYDRSKAEASLVVSEAAREGLDAVIVCPTGVIGPFDYRRSEMAELILRCMKSGPQLAVKGAYDFVDVRDVAHGQMLAMEHGKSGESYILSGERISVDDLIALVRELANIRAPHINLPFWLARFAALFTPLYYRLTHTRPIFTTYSLATLVSNSYISSAKARRELGYNPRPIRDTLSDTINWFRQNH